MDDEVNTHVGDHLYVYLMVANMGVSWSWRHVHHNLFCIYIIYPSDVLTAILLLMSLRSEETF